MSSYQFVNSLASSCYVGRGGAGGTADLSGMSAADYYATAMSNYQNCYPQAQQAQHYADFNHLGQQVQHPQHSSMPMSPMSNGGVDFSMTHHVQQQQPIQQQQQPIQQQSMRPASSQRLNSVASPVNLGGTLLFFFNPMKTLQSFVSVD